MNDKFEPIRRQQTNGANFDLSTEDIITRLEAWDQRYGVEISDVGFDKVTVTFERLPEDLEAFAQEVYDFCPDTVNQNFGCIDEMIEAAEEMGQEVSPEIRELIQGVDLDADGYGVELMRRDIAKNRIVALWWD